VGQQAVLKLQIHRRLPFLPPVRIKLPIAQKAEVESIVDRYLSEWPSPAILTDGVRQAVE
jgi:hypothetical protein